MKIRLIAFNTYLAWVVLLAPILCGCLTTSSKKKEASLRFHLEANLDGTERSQPITIGRTSPFAMGIESRSFLTEFNIEHASVVDSPGGGFALSIQFNKEGGWILEQYSTVNKGRRMAIVAEFGELRWIAAPTLRDRITNGLFVFTPDTTREEAERIADGVNVVAEKVRKGLH